MLLTPEKRQECEFWCGAAELKFWSYNPLWHISRGKIGARLVEMDGKCFPSLASHSTEFREQKLVKADLVMDARHPDLSVQWQRATANRITTEPFFPQLNIHQYGCWVILKHRWLSRVLWQSALQRPLILLKHLHVLSSYNGELYCIHIRFRVTSKRLKKRKIIHGLYFIYLNKNLSNVVWIYLVSWF